MTDPTLSMIAIEVTGAVVALLVAAFVFDDFLIPSIRRLFRKRKPE